MASCVNNVFGPSLSPFVSVTGPLYCPRICVINYPLVVPGRQSHTPRVWRQNSACKSSKGMLIIYCGDSWTCVCGRKFMYNSFEFRTMLGNLQKISIYGRNFTH